MLNNKIETHPWKPFIPASPKIIFFGAFPPKENKWSMDFYYPNKINDFWRIFGKIFHNNYSHYIDSETKLFDKERIIETLKIHGIAIADIAYKVVRLKDNASDKFLEIIEPINLIKILSDFPSCDTIISTGLKAAETIAIITNSQIPKIGSYTEVVINNRKIKIYRMPSTSRAYPLAIDKKTRFYHQLFLDAKIL